MRARKSLVENRKIGGTKKAIVNSGRRSRDSEREEMPEKLGPMAENGAASPLPPILFELGLA
jgi:hypothetical protein